MNIATFINPIMCSLRKIVLLKNVILTCNYKCPDWKMEYYSLLWTFLYTF